MKKMRTWIIIAVVVIVVVGGFLVLRSRASSTKMSEYQTATIERGDLVATVGATGTVRTNQSVMLSWETGGTVDEVFVDVGDRVSKGAVLANLDKTSLSSNIILAQADLVSAEKALDDLLNSNTASAQAAISLRDAEERLNKAQDYRDTLDEPYKYDQIVYKMVGSTRVPEVKTRKVDEADDETKAIADEDLALAQAQYNDAYREWQRLSDGPDASDIEAAQARIDAALATLDMAHVTAPFEGTVTLVDNLPGDQVMAGTQAFRLDDMSRLLVDVELSEIDINNVSLGQNVQVSFDAILNKEYNGTVIEVGQIGNDQQGAVNFTVTIELTDADSLVRPGMTAAVNIVVKEIKNEILIPNRAVRLVDGKRVVYLMKNGALDQVEIRLGANAETMSVLVSDNVPEGSEIVLNPPTSGFEMGGGPPPGMRR